MEARKNLCAMIPESLHARVRQEQESLGKTLSELVEQILIEHYERGGNPMATKTLAIQISEELLLRMKEYLAKYHITQKEFITNLIEHALESELES